MSLKAALVDGIERRDRTDTPILFRYLATNDDLDALTELLHDAYAPLAAAGMRFFASHQNVEVTRQRASRGPTIVAVAAGQIAGTVTLFKPTEGPPFYLQPDVLCVGQYGVAPAMQNRHIGSRLMDLAEELARESGAAFVGLDTSEHATRLIAFYERRGYRFVTHHRRRSVNYRSVVMALALAERD